MVALSCQFNPILCKNHRGIKPKSPYIFCTAQPSQSNIKVIINGAAKEIGRAAVIAVTKARGMEVAGAVDSYLVGEDIGKVCDMEDPLEIPIMNDLTMVLGSISQSKARGVVVDFTDPSQVYDNVKQAIAFGMNSVVYVPRIKPDTISALSAFCEKASMGCLVAPTLSIGSILLQQAAISASFHYKNVEIVESKDSAMDLPSADATQIANNLSNLGQIYNREDLSSEVLVSLDFENYDQASYDCHLMSCNSFVSYHKGKGSSSWRRRSSCAQFSPSGASFQYNCLLFWPGRGLLSQT